MKFALIAILAFLPTLAFADEVVCYNNSNSDYELHLTFRNDLLTSIVRINQDWGGAGYGGFQAVTPLSANEYEVTWQASGTTGLKVGDIVHLDLDGSKIKTVTVLRDSEYLGNTYGCP